MLASVSAEWKETIRPVFERFQDRTPGSQLEEKRHSLAWHFRNAEPELAAVRLAELKDALISMTTNIDLSVLEGNQVLEIKPVAFDKGHAVRRFIADSDWDFILAIGDDHTDEFMFEALADSGTAIKVGAGVSAADFYVESVSDVHALLNRLASAS
jgi:trehalose 6-phosphate synthase/phosphatase